MDLDEAIEMVTDYGDARSSEMNDYMTGRTSYLDNERSNKEQAAIEEAFGPYFSDTVTVNDNDLRHITREAWKVGQRCPHVLGAVCTDCITTNVLTAILKSYRLVKR